MYNQIDTEYFAYINLSHQFFFRVADLFFFPSHLDLAYGIYMKSMPHNSVIITRFKYHFCSIIIGARLKFFSFVFRMDTYIYFACPSSSLFLVCIVVRVKKKNRRYYYISNRTICDIIGKSVTTHTIAQHIFIYR